MGLTGRHGREDVPKHPCLEFVSNSEDKLTQMISRRLITMRKREEYDERKQAEYKEVTRRSLKQFNLSYNDLMEMVEKGGESEA